MVTTGRLDLDCSAPASEIIGALVAELARDAGLTDRQAYWLRLSADEITENIARHGYQGRGGRVSIEGGIDGSLAWIRVEDEAPAFDPASHDPAPRVEAGPTGREGGFGLLLALRNLDDFSYEYVDGRNRSTLMMRRHGPGDDPGGTEGGFGDASADHCRAR
jgi:serine/threonine-protein kinase RsbW